MTRWDLYAAAQKYNRRDAIGDVPARDVLELTEMVEVSRRGASLRISPMHTRDPPPAQATSPSGPAVWAAPVASAPPFPGNQPQRPVQSLKKLVVVIYDTRKVRTLQVSFTTTQPHAASGGSGGGGVRFDDQVVPQAPILAPLNSWALTGVPWL